MKTTLPIKIKAYEIDAMGVVSNIVYVKWLEDARHAFLDKYYPYGDMVLAGVSPAMMKNEITYKKPFNISDSPTATLWITKLTKMRWEIYTEFTFHGTLHCYSTQSGCFVDIKTGRPTTVPEKLMAAYFTEKERLEPQ
jgi:acyl-CoA thioester hydrolase